MSLPEFNTCFSKTYYRIPNAERPNAAMALLYYLETYDGIFGILLREKDLHNLEEAQAVAIKLERNILAAYRFPSIHVPNQLVKVTPFNDIQPLVEFLVIEKGQIDQLAPYQGPGDKHDNNDSCLDAHEPIVTPLESYAEFHEDEDDELSFQARSINDDEVWQKEPINP